MNLVPFIEVIGYRGVFIRQVVLNVIMTIPFFFNYQLLIIKSKASKNNNFYIFIKFKY